MDRIGERIKRIREHKALQLNDLAKRVGISPSALSQIEKAKTYPSIITLKQIAEKLQTTVGELIGENESLFNNPVFRKEENLFIEQNDSGTQVFIVSQHDVSKQMETFMLKFQLNSDSLNLFTRHNGQIFGYLLDGELQFEIDNKSYVVLPGDTIYFNSRRNFRFQNIFKGQSKLLCTSIASK
ncbi:MAG: helix-turn-helix domain-containing protein [Paludibacter sp.]